MPGLSEQLESFPELERYVLSVGSSVSPEDLDIYLKVRGFQDRSYQQRALIDAWKEQHEQDRATRKYYARWLLLVVCAQIAVINILFVLIGLGLLRIEVWTANTFIVSIFAEISGMVLIVVNYLFPKSRGSDGALLDMLRRGESK